MALSCTGVGLTLTKTAFSSSAAAGLSGDSHYFDGDDSLSMSQANFGDPNSTKLTWAGTIRLLTGSTSVFNPISMGTNRFAILVDGDANVQVYLNGTLRFTGGIATTRIQTGFPVHLAVIVDTTQAVANDRVKVYIDGSQITGLYGTAIAQNTAITFTTGTATIGGTGASAYLYRPALIVGSVPLITDLFNTTTMLQVEDLTGLTGLNSYLKGTGSSVVQDDIKVADWTVVGSTSLVNTQPTTYTTTRGNKSLYLANSSTQGLYVAQSSTNLDVTVINSTKVTYSVWLNKLNNTGTHTVVSSRQDLTTGTVNFEITKNAATSWIVGVNTGSSVSTANFTPTDSLSTWFHLCVVVDTTQAVAADRIKCYINGSALSDAGGSSYPTQNNVMTWAAGTGRWAIGSRTNSGGYNPFVGYMFDPALFDGALGTPPTVAQLYNSGTSPNPLTYASSLRLAWASRTTAGSTIDKLGGWSAGLTMFASSNAPLNQVGATMPVTDATIPTF